MGSYEGPFGSAFVGPYIIGVISFTYKLNNKLEPNIISYIYGIKSIIS